MDITKAIIQTTGVYIFANLEIKFSDLDFTESDSSTNFSILETVESPKFLVVRIFNTPVIFIQPLITSSPQLTSQGTLSPVRAPVLSKELP